MKDRTIRSKSPWMRLFTVGNPKPLDELDKAHYETVEQIRNLQKTGRGLKGRVLK